MCGTTLTQTDKTDLHDLQLNQATGIAQCAELCWQLRNEAGPRQVKDVKVALAHNIGLGGAAVCTVLRKPEEWAAIAPKRKQSLATGPPTASKL